MKNLAFVALLMGLAACSPIALTTTFNPNEAAYIHTKGKGAISGQAFLRRNDGIVVYAAGSEVVLVPVTTYSQERVNALYKGSKIAYFSPGFKNDDPAYQQYKRTTTANGEGRFSFTDLADGSYFITTSVVWFAGNYQQGGSLLERVTISGGKQTEVIMTGV